MRQDVKTTSIRYPSNVLERRQRAAAEFLAWADHHAHLMARMEAAQAQLGVHSEQDQRSAAAQQQVWARRKMHERHLHDSAMAQLRHG